MIWTILRRITYRFPSLISANSRNCLKQLESFTDKKKLIYLPNPILFQKKFKIRLCKKKIIAVGRLHHQKGFDILIKAFFKSKLYTRGWTLEIYGNGQLQYELDNLVKNFKLEKYIFLNSFITDIERIYNSASIFVMSSRFEGMPNVLLEAVSYKVPCIVSNKVRAAFEFLKHKESCLKFESENINDLKKNLENLTSKRILRKRIATKAFNQLNKYFSKKKILMEWKKIVE